MKTSSLSLSLFLSTHIYMYTLIRVCVYMYMYNIILGGCLLPYHECPLFLSKMVTGSACSVNSPKCPSIKPTVRHFRTASWAFQGKLSKGMIPHYFGITDLFENVVILRKGPFPWVHPHNLTNEFQGLRSWFPSVNSPEHSYSDCGPPRTRCDHKLFAVHIYEELSIEMERKWSKPFTAALIATTSTRVVTGLVSVNGSKI